MRWLTIRRMTRLSDAGKGGICAVVRTGKGVIDRNVPPALPVLLGQPEAAEPEKKMFDGRAEGRKRGLVLFQL